MKQQMEMEQSKDYVITTFYPYIYSINFIKYGKSLSPWLTTTSTSLSPTGKEVYFTMFLIQRNEKGSLKMVYFTDLFSLSLSSTRSIQ